MNGFISPTIGRVVHFYPGPHAYPNKPQAAIITYVHNECMVNLAVFDEYGESHPTTSVTLLQENDTPLNYRFCMWMPYQIGQAKKG